MWTPTHVVVTVTKAKNLLDKGKGGNDAYCIIGLGKEKFLTSVKPRTINPVWDEQAEFGLTEREELKVTVYHKSALIDEFVGRATINIIELANDNINTHSQWYKLQGKPDKEHKKAEKDRGEIEVRVDFLVKPKSGSIADLSKTKDKSLSLKSLKDKSLNIKHSIGDKFKSLHRSGSKKSKTNGENQLADQAKRMGGSKLDFLDGDDYSSLTSSYSSINGPSLMRVATEVKQNRYSPRSSIISETSSINEQSRVEDDLDDSVSVQAAKLSSKSRAAPPPPLQINTPKTVNKEIGIDVLPPKPDTTIVSQDTSPATSTPQTRMRSILKKPEKFNDAPLAPPTTTTMPKMAPKAPIITKSPPKEDEYEENEQETADSFASIFAQSMGDTFKRDEKKPAPVAPKASSPPSQQQRSTRASLPPKPELPKQSSKYEVTTSSSANSTNSTNNNKKSADTSFTGSNNGNKSYTYDEDIDWASSDEEIVKQQIAHFERNQVSRNSSIRGSKARAKAPQLPPPLPPLPQVEAKPRTPSPPPVERQSDVTPAPLQQHQQQVKPTSKVLEYQSEEAFKSPVKFFNTDIDPFSSSSSSSSKQPSRTSSLNKNQQQDLLAKYFTNKKMTEEEEKPAGLTVDDDMEAVQLDFDKIDELLNTSTPFSDPFSGLNFKTESKTEDEVIEEKSQARSPSTSSSSISSPDMSPILKRKSEPVIASAMQPQTELEQSTQEEQRQETSNDVEAKDTNEVVDDDIKMELTDDVEIKPLRVSESDFNGFEPKPEQQQEKQQDVRIPEIDILDNPFLNSNDDDDDDEATRYSNQDVVSRKTPILSATESIISTTDQNDNDQYPSPPPPPPQQHPQSQKSEILTESADANYFKRSTTLTQSQRRRLMPTEDLTSDLNSDTDNYTRKTSSRDANNNHQQTNQRNNLQFNFPQKPTTKSTISQRRQQSESDDDIKTPDIDNIDFAFQEHRLNGSKRGDELSLKSGKSPMTNRGGLPDILQQQKRNSVSAGSKSPNDKINKKCIDGLESVPLGEITVPDTLRKQLEYFDREELLQLIAYQKKFIDYKESRIKDLDNYIDNLVVRVIEANPTLLMQCGTKLAPRFK